MFTKEDVGTAQNYTGIVTRTVHWKQLWPEGHIGGTRNFLACAQQRGGVSKGETRKLSINRKRCSSKSSVQEAQGHGRLRKGVSARVSGNGRTLGICM